MLASEYERMARAEKRHWWYRGLRDVLSRSLTRKDLALAPQPRVLDAGCGTGANLELLGRLLGPSYLGGFDASQDAVRRARARAVEADVYKADICAPELHVETLDLVVSLDVIYIPGVERARGGLERLVGALRPGGLFVLNLPAYEWLRAEHDLAVHTAQRFTAADVRRLFDDLGLAVRRLSYRVFFAFPLVVAARLPGMLRVRRGRAAARSDLEREPGAAVNALLFAGLRAENTWIARGGRLPWGSSVFAIGSKR